MKKFTIILIITILCSGLERTLSAQKFYKTLQSYSNSLPDEFSSIPDDRKAILDEMSTYLHSVLNERGVVRPLFICTHNSRRSHMGQIWLLAASYYYGIGHVAPSSGGTEATAFNPRAVEALRRAGFEILEGESNPDNPFYQVFFGTRYTPVLTWSKKYDDAANPSKEFFAIMVCSEADASCPLVAGAEKRFSLPYDDPRYSDNTASETKTYDDACRLIAREMFYLMSQVKKQVVDLQESKK